MAISLPGWREQGQGARHFTSRKWRTKTHKDTDNFLVTVTG
jgi:hypothetical protein